MEDFELIGSRPPSVVSIRPPSTQRTDRPPSAQRSDRPKSGYKTINNKSSVDELLFSSHHNSNREDKPATFKSPWVITPKSKNEKLFKKSKMRPLLWVPEDRKTGTSQSDRRCNHAVSRSHNHAGDLNRFRPVKQIPSFCDEGLFGPRLDEPSFEAPWAEKTKRKQPFLFSPVDYAKLTREGTTLSAKYSSSGTMDGRPPSRQGRRPVTASTRPVTVEGTQDLERTHWKP